MGKLASYDRDGAIGIISLHSPPMNQMGIDLFEELDAIYDTIAADDTTVVVLRSDINGVFSAGADLPHVLETVANDTEAFVEEMAFYQDVFERMSEIETVFIAAINGHCLAGGFELAIGSDLRYMARGDHEFGAIEAEIGAIPAAGTQRLLREVGRSTAFEMIATAKRLSPEEADDLGLVQELFDPEDLEDAVMDRARDLADGPTKAIIAGKKGVRHGQEMTYQHAIEYQKELLYDVLATDDFEEGVQAFVEDREPEFTGE